MADKKNITLIAYEIENEDIRREYSDLYEKLSLKLKSGETANERRMRLNETSSEEDLLSDFAVTEKYVYGVMWRITPAKEAPSIPEGLFSHNKIQIGDIQEKEKNKSLICKDHYYFALDKFHLVTNLPKSRIKALQVYLNWLLSATRGDNLYQFTPKIKAPEDTKLSDIKMIVFDDPMKKNKGKNNNEKVEDKYKVIKFAKEQLLKLIQDGVGGDLNKLINQKILSAQLLVKFSKPRKMEEEDYEKLLGAYMKPVCDTDGVTLNLKNGKKITGSNILVSDDVEVEMIDAIRISEKDLMLEMEKLLRKLKK